MIPERTLRTGPGLRARRGDERKYESEALAALLKRITKEYETFALSRMGSVPPFLYVNRTEGAPPPVVLAFASQPEYSWMPGAAVAVAAAASRRVTTWHTARFRWVMSRWLDTGGITLDRVMTLEEAWIAENVRLIKTIPPRYHGALRDALGRVQPGQPFNRQALSGVFSEGFKSAGYNLRRLTRDQTTKFVGQLNQSRQTEVGIDRYKWLTAGDERVRPSHRANEGLVFFWDSPPVNTGHPGEDVNCRCVALPVLS